MNKIYCPSCGQSREAKLDETYPFKICDSCIDHRDKDHSHSEEDVQNEIQKNIDKTIKNSIR